MCVIGFSDYILFLLRWDNELFIIYGEFDPGSERTLAACLIHASRARKSRKGLVERQTGE